ncbi:MAG: hypothetical protein SNJ71_08485 [Bacteroidales bacterium]
MEYEWSNNIQNNKIILPTHTQTYYLTATDVNGCKNIDSITITVFPLPSVIIQASATKACFGDTIYLTTTDTYKSYLWSDGRTSKTVFFTQPIENNHIKLTVVDTIGCTQQTSTIISIYNTPSVELGNNRGYCKDSIIKLYAPPHMDSYTWNTGANTQSIQILETGFYSLTVTKNGCTNSDNVYITINSPISIDIGNRLHICKGDSLYLSPGTGFDTYTWNTGNTTLGIWVTQAGEYSVTVTNGTCIAQDSVEIVVHPKPIPKIYSNKPNNTICTGDSLQLKAELQYKYQWSDESKNQTLYAKSEGTYSLTVTDEYGCKADTSIIVKLYPPLTPRLWTSTPTNEACWGDDFFIYTEK